MRLLTTTLLIAACWAAWPAVGRADDARFIRGLYEEYLNRTPAPQDVRDWQDLMDANGWSRREVRARFLASEEFFDLHQRDRSRMIRGLFRHLAGRAPSRDDVDTWLLHWQAN